MTQEHLTKKPLTYTLTAMDPDTGQGWRARIDSPTEITILLAEDDEELARVAIGEGKVPMMEMLDPTMKIPESVGKRLAECVTACEGNELCVACCVLDSVSEFM